MQKITVGTVLAIAVMGTVVSVLVAGLFVASQSIYNTGNVKAVGVGAYWDSGCTDEVSSINWGDLEPNETKDVIMYVKNEGSVAMTLGMTTDNWDPESASSFMTLSWNREDYMLDTGSTVQAVLTLSVSSDISGIANFNFNITITGTEHV